MAAVVCLAACGSHKSMVTAVDGNATTLIVFYDASVGKAPLMRAIDKSGSELVYDYVNLNGVAVRVPSSMTESQAIDYYNAVKGVLSVQRDQKMQLQ